MDHALTFLLYATTAFLAALEGLILWKMASNRLDLGMLLSNGQGGASLSRFQLLVFTFVIAASFVLGGMPSASAEPFPALFPLLNLLPAAGGDGSEGFVLSG